MATTKLKGEEVKTSGELCQKGEKAPGFELVTNDLQSLTLEDLKGKKVILNVFPSLDTGVCAATVRKFNEEAASLDNTQVVCVSRDLPFAQKRFCGAEGIENIITASAFRDDSFDKDYGLKMTSGPMRGLLARAVLVLDEDGKVVDSQLVPEITQEPDYERAISAVRA